MHGNYYKNAYPIFLIKFAFVLFKIKILVKLINYSIRKTILDLDISTLK
jgi:hypothetical protein